jgi:alpha-D-ribose 1-methylphosphonate 5-triphosphate synthase subunit PhnH
MVKELLSIAGPGLHGIVNRSEEAYNHDLNLNTKAELLAKWDEETPVIIDYNKIPKKIFQKIIIFSDNITFR